MNKRLYSLPFIGLLALIGCDSLPTARAICLEDPQLCRGLNEDGWCQAQREKVIYSEYELKQKRTEPKIYNALVAWEGYRDCSELAGHVEMKRLKIRQSQRIGGYIRAEEAIRDLLKETAKSNHPSLLWYHWSREGNQAAYEKFVALEESGQLDTPELVLHIAAHYAGDDQEKAIDYLLKAVAMYDDEDDIDPVIFSRLTTLTYQVGDYKHSYVWALVTKERDAGTVNMKLINESSKLTIFEQKRAQEIADDILSQLGDPGFKPRRHYRF